VTQGSRLLAWHNDPALKARTIATAQAHLAADLLEHGSTGSPAEGYRGCSVACTLGVYDHTLAPELIGMPRWLTSLQDSIYENLPRDARELDVRWTIDLLEARPVGVEEDRALVPILVRVLREVALPAVTVDRWGVRDAIHGVIRALETGEHLAAARSAEDARAAASEDRADAEDVEDVEAEAARAAARDAWASDAAIAAAAAAAAAEAADAVAASVAVGETSDAVIASAAAAGIVAGADAVDAWERIRAIVLDEIGKLQSDDAEDVTS